MAWGTCGSEATERQASVWVKVTEVKSLNIPGISRRRQSPGNLSAAAEGALQATPLALPPPVTA